MNNAEKLIAVFLVLAGVGLAAMLALKKTRPSSKPGSSTSTTKPISPPNLPVSAGDAKRLAAGNNAFALDLYQELKSTDGNIFFSPYSISGALCMTYAGAMTRTAEQMKQVLHIALPAENLHRTFAEEIRKQNAPGKPYELAVANALWGQKGYSFRREFLSLLDEQYGAQMNIVDFAKAGPQAVATINAWVSERTRGKIQNIISPSAVSDLTRLILTNAIYFKGTWASQFKESRTRKEPFHLQSGGTKQIPLMRQTAKFDYAANEGVQVLKLPYVGDELSMVVVLPRETLGLPELEKALTMERLDGWLSGLARRKVSVLLPKFKMDSKFSLSATLKAMGMTDAFIENLSGEKRPHADFSGMDGTDTLFISEVLHKAFVDVNEEGTEAAAATAVVMRKSRSAGPRIPQFRADHPFLFLIREDRTGSILFIGRLSEPDR